LIFKLDRIWFCASATQDNTVAKKPNRHLYYKNGLNITSQIIPYFTISRLFLLVIGIGACQKGQADQNNKARNP